MAQVLVSIIDEVPITKLRPVPEDLHRDIPNPGLPRANKAVSRERPEGSPGANPHLTVLQQHMEFWDRDNAGVIWPKDTYVGFRRLGFNILISFVAMTYKHLCFSYATLDSWIPHLGFPIYIKNVHRTKHGSDSGTYDTEGRFVPQKFEEIFSKYDEGNKGGLSLKDIGNMLRSNMNVFDFFGWFSERTEWYVFYLLAANEDGLITRESTRAMFDGTLFYKIATEREGGQQPESKVEENTRKAE